MGNIFAFLIRHHKFFVFAILEWICFSLVVNYNKDQGSTFSQFSNEISGLVYKSFTGMKYYFHLRETNDSLMAENARLRAKMSNAMYFDTAKNKNIADTVFKQRYTFIPCDVVNNSVTGIDNYHTLGAGTNKGIGKHLGVVSTVGIVGITRNVSQHFCSVLSVLHKDFTVSGEIKEVRQIGTLTWDGRNPNMVVMKDIPLNTRLKAGMHVVTSPFSDLFPQGTPVGYVVKFEPNHNDANYTVYVWLHTDMQNLRKVYVVNNLMRDEKQKTEPQPDKR